MEENTFINGVVFRKNVSHKKMATDSSKVNPKILILAGGIDFQRQDTRLSSMDTLIEQEDKYIEILVDKIMSLDPGECGCSNCLFEIYNFDRTKMLAQILFSWARQSQDELKNCCATTKLWLCRMSSQRCSSE
jgi:hypothetical protein